MKIGQALSARPDLLPKVYLDTLSGLQDRLPPFPTDVAYAGRALGVCAGGHQVNKERAQQGKACRAGSPPFTEVGHAGWELWQCLGQVATSGAHVAWAYVKGRRETVHS